MVRKVITLPGVPRPIIYNYNRRGAWTIDETRAFVPFGEEFPSSPLHDQIARDPDLGHFVGINNALGVLRTRSRRHSVFRKLHGISPTSLRHPYSVEFIPRFSSFVISDPPRLARGGPRRLRLRRLLDQRSCGLAHSFKSFELADFNCSSDRSGPRHCPESGPLRRREVVRGAIFDRNNYLLGVTVGAGRHPVNEQPRRRRK